MSQGGFNSISRLSSAEMYNPTTNTWTRIADMVHPRSNFALEVVDDSIYAIGGFNGVTTITKVDCYDDRTNDCKTQSLSPHSGTHSSSLTAKANRVHSLTGSPDFRKWESCRTMPLVGGFSRGSPVSPAFSIQRLSVFTSITLIASQDLAVKSRPNFFTHSKSGHGDFFRSAYEAQYDLESAKTPADGTRPQLTEENRILLKPWRCLDDRTQLQLAEENRIPQTPRCCLEPRCTMTSPVLPDGEIEISTPWGMCVTERGNDEIQSSVTAKYLEEVLEVAAIDLEPSVKTTPKIVKGTGEDMLRDGIDSCDNVGLEFFERVRVVAVGLLVCSATDDTIRLEHRLNARDRYTCSLRRGSILLKVSIVELILRQLFRKNIVNVFDVTSRVHSLMEEHGDDVNPLTELHSSCLVHILQHLRSDIGQKPLTELHSSCLVHILQHLRSNIGQKPLTELHSSCLVHILQHLRSDIGQKPLTELHSSCLVHILQHLRSNIGQKPLTDLHSSCLVHILQLMHHSEFVRVLLQVLHQDPHSGWLGHLQLSRQSPRRFKWTVDLADISSTSLYMLLAHWSVLPGRRELSLHSHTQCWIPQTSSQPWDHQNLLAAKRDGVVYKACLRILRICITSPIINKRVHLPRDFKRDNLNNSPGIDRYNVLPNRHDKQLFNRRSSLRRSDILVPHNAHSRAHTRHHLASTPAPPSGDSTNEDQGRRGGIVVRLFTSHLGEEGFIPGRVSLVFSQVGIVPGRCRWSAGFLGDLPFPPNPTLRRCSILTLFHPHRVSSPQSLNSAFNPSVQLILHALLRRIPTRHLGFMEFMPYSGNTVLHNAVANQHEADCVATLRRRVHCAMFLSCVCRREPATEKKKKTPPCWGSLHALLCDTRHLVRHSRDAAGRYEVTEMNIFRSALSAAVVSGLSNLHDYIRGQSEERNKKWRKQVYQQTRRALNLPGGPFPLVILRRPDIVANQLLELDRDDDDDEEEDQSENFNLGDDQDIEMREYRTEDMEE
ncbi:hypothetical protein PR048_033113 [Dryococelus australis]|uniref:Uncharacterized protein n=1 Tax=Dryococelus australis TaxID=614101 RepID=A0ABQ9G0A4_9NEOP|nr:hypothetical protein PR048_033113 [Dryococelus australis]